MLKLKLRALMFGAFALPCFAANSAWSTSLKTPQCAKFEEVAIQGMATEGLIVIQDGKKVFEYFDGEGKAPGNGFVRNAPHALWSASKTLTATLLAAAIQQGKTYADPNGRVQPLSLESPLSHFFPSSERKVRYGEIRENDRELYERILLKHLVDMSSNFEWDESYESGITTSSFLPMLYIREKKGGGLENMSNYALSFAMREFGPGRIWNYSGGNSVILQAVLRKVYGEQAYKTLPWDLLFTPIGIDPKEAVWERDGTGLFVGSSYAMMTPSAMARVGLLFLNGGKSDGKQIIPESWVRDAQELTPGVTDPNSATPLSLVKKEGVFGKRVFWMNLPVSLPNEKGEMETYGPEFPDAPRDMYFSAGHYGQLIIVIPSRKMVIVRTGSDAEYWSKINAMVTATLGCFGGGS